MTYNLHYEQSNSRKLEQIVENSPSLSFCWNKTKSNADNEYMLAIHYGNSYIDLAFQFCVIILFCYSLCTSIHNSWYLDKFQILECNQEEHMYLWQATIALKSYWHFWEFQARLWQLLIGTIIQSSFGTPFSSKKPRVKELGGFLVLSEFSCFFVDVSLL